jgi:ElaB/YqjD/DUF883 family membrane-anchored ribosome-binding protein
MTANPQDISSERVVSDFKSVISDAEELLKATANQSGERLVALRAKLEDSLRSATEHVLEAEQVLVERTREAARATDRFVQDNPWKTAGIAAAIGLLIGLLVSRR